MTVREACSVLTDAKELYIGWDGCLTRFNDADALIMDAFGSYKVERICAAGDKPEMYELTIAAAPMKEVRA